MTASQRFGHHRTTELTASSWLQGGAVAQWSALSPHRREKVAGWILGLGFAFPLGVQEKKFVQMVKDAGPGIQKQIIGQMSDALWGSCLLRFV